MIMKPLGYQQADITAGAVFTPTVPLGANFALVQAQTHELIYRSDGVDPSNGPPKLGHYLWYPGGGAGGYNLLEFDGDLSKLRLLNEDPPSTCIIGISYYKKG